MLRRFGAPLCLAATISSTWRPCSTSNNGGNSQNDGAPKKKFSAAELRRSAQPAPAKHSVKTTVIPANSMWGPRATNGQPKRMYEKEEPPAQLDEDEETTEKRTNNKLRRSVSPPARFAQKRDEFIKSLSPASPSNPVKQMIKKYGFGLVVYYFLFNETCVCIVTYLLHYDFIGGADIIAWLKWGGADKLVNVDQLLSSAINIGPLTISAKFVTNFALASAFMSLWTFAQLPFCMATLPILQRALGSFWRSKARGATEGVAVGTASAAAVAAVTSKDDVSSAAAAASSGEEPSVSDDAKAKTETSSSSASSGKE